MNSSYVLLQMDIEGSRLNYCRTDLRDEGIQLCQLAQQEANDLGLKPDSFRSKLTARFKRGRRQQLAEDPKDGDEAPAQASGALRFWIRYGAWLSCFSEGGPLSCLHRNVIEADSNSVMLSHQPAPIVKQMAKYSKGGLPKQLRGVLRVNNHAQWFLYIDERISLSCHLL
jgi:hypothetical protein